MFCGFDENQPLIEPVRRDIAIGGTVFDQCKQTFKRSTQGTPVILLALDHFHLASCSHHGAT